MPWNKDSNGKVIIFFLFLLLLLSLLLFLMLFISISLLDKSPSLLRKSGTLEGTQKPEVSYEGLFFKEESSAR